MMQGGPKTIIITAIPPKTFPLMNDLPQQQQPERCSSTSSSSSSFSSSLIRPKTSAPLRISPSAAPPMNSSFLKRPMSSTSSSSTTTTGFFIPGGAQSAAKMQLPPRSAAASPYYVMPPQHHRRRMMMINSWATTERRKHFQENSYSSSYYGEEGDEDDDDDDFLSSDCYEFQPPRKRERLNHLSPDEKMYRRKLKNRIAAQTARDRKKVLMEDLEERVKRLEAENEFLRNQNNKLTTVTSELCDVNEHLKSELSNCVVENGQQKDHQNSKTIKVESDSPPNPTVDDSGAVEEQVVATTSSLDHTQNVMEEQATAPAAVGSAESINDLQQQGQVTSAAALPPTPLSPLILFLTIVTAMNNYSIGCNAFSNNTFKAICLKQQNQYKTIDSTQIMHKIRQEIVRLSISAEGKQLLTNKLEELLRSRKISKLKMG